MKSLVVVSLFGVAALVGLPAGAQVTGQTMPAPYAPPVAPQFQQPPAERGAPEGIVDGQPPAELALPTGDPAYGQQQPASDPSDPNALNAQYDPNAAANYPQPDLGPDNDIAQSYDDGYDAQASTISSRPRSRLTARGTTTAPTGTSGRRACRSSAPASRRTRRAATG